MKLIEDKITENINKNRFKDDTVLTVVINYKFKQMIFILLAR